jgi:hypothetical protein
MEGCQLVTRHGLDKAGTREMSVRFLRILAWVYAVISSHSCALNLLGTQLSDDCD